jgi:hypothetical protein
MFLLVELRHGGHLALWIGSNAPVRSGYSSAGIGG